jgi:hypothetical protein
MTVLITIQSPDSDINTKLGYFIGNARDRDEKRWRRPRSLLKRLRDALSPDQPRWNGRGGNEWNNMPGFAFEYKTKEIVWTNNEWQTK